jgi:hypothetical protein
MADGLKYPFFVPKAAAPDAIFAWRRDDRPCMGRGPDQGKKDNRV